MDPQQLQKILKGKTPDQKKAINYFLNTGCFSGVISDDEYAAMVRTKKDSLKLREKALAKINLDEDEVKEIAPAKFEGYVFDNAWAKQTANGKWVSSAYQVSWCFFSSSQIYLFRHTFNMDEDKKTETTDEFFYKDVTSFSTATTQETPRGTDGNTGPEVETSKFFMVVPGDKLYMSMDGEPNAESIIQGIKQKLREKKNA
jgi:hypothetical protein